METLNLTNLLIILLVGIVLFLLLREVNCWYWKINRKIELQEETNHLLKKLVDQTMLKEFKSQDTADFPTEQTSVNDPKVMEELLKKLDKKQL